MEGEIARVKAKVTKRKEAQLIAQINTHFIKVRELVMEILQRVKSASKKGVHCVEVSNDCHHRKYAVMELKNYFKVEEFGSCMTRYWVIKYWKISW